MKSIIISIKMLLVMSAITGIFYPIFITLIAQAIFPDEAKGSLIINNGRIIGSKLIAQSFDSIIYFSSRPSFISYNPLPSGGSNYGTTSKKLDSLINQNKLKFINKNLIDRGIDLPSEMIFFSGSGLDPHISPEAALLQVNRIVKARKFNETQRKQLAELINNLTVKPQFLLFGEPRINVLLLNLGLDKIGGVRHKA